MYTGDKTHRITVRMSEDLYLFVEEQAKMLGVTSAEFLRMVVKSAYSMNQKLAERFKSAIPGGEEHENG